MARGFVVMTPASIYGVCERAGFTQLVHGGEVVFDRIHARCPHITIRVFTSVSARAGVTRECGADAIRVVAFWRDGDRSRGVARTTRVHRTGTVEGVQDRMLTRMREAYAAANEFVRRGCPSCRQ